MTVAELRDRLTWNEFRLWLAVFEVEAEEMAVLHGKPPPIRPKHAGEILEIFRQYQGHDGQRA